MATLDDKILGEKLHYYCSSSEDEDDEQPKDDDSRKGCKSSQPKFIPEAEVSDWEKSTSNTGPKGVIKDWQRYKQLETEKREENEAEKLLLMQKLTLSCRSHLDDEKEKKKDSELDKELNELLKDEFMKEYMQKRMREMMNCSQERPKYGKLINLLSGSEFLDAIDKTPKCVTVVIHLYENSSPGCQAMNGCLQCLAQDYGHVKFCKLSASTAGVSKHFKKNGIPALLVYKEGNLIGNFVNLTDEFGDDFFACDVESYLLEHGMLTDKSLVPKLIKESEHASGKSEQHADSDFELE